MKEVIEEILQEEKEARQRVESAREEAKKIRINAEEASGKLVKKVRDEAQIESQKIIEQAKKDAENKKAQALSDEARASESQWDEKKDAITKTIQELFGMIINRFQPNK